MEELVVLGTKLIEHTDYETLKSQYTDKDFKDWTTLKIIMKNGLHKLIKDQKVNDLLNEIWNGEDDEKCDGSMKYYSSLAYANVTIRHIKGWSVQLKDTFFNGIKDRPRWEAKVDKERDDNQHTKRK